MSEFKDSEGRKWRINLTLGGVKKVMDELGINLLDLTQFADTSDGSATLKLVNDDLFVGEIVAILLEKQAEGYGLKREDVLDLSTARRRKERRKRSLRNTLFFSRTAKTRLRRSSSTKSRKLAKWSQLVRRLPTRWTCRFSRLREVRALRTRRILSGEHERAVGADVAIVRSRCELSFVEEKVQSERLQPVR